MARLELYNYSYFKDLYDKAYDNYVEKIEEIENIKQNKREILSGKDDLQQKIRELKTSENKAKANIIPFIDEDVRKSINSAKESVGAVFKAIPGVDKIKKEGFMNMGVDKVKGLFDKVKIDPKALLKI